MLILIGTYTRDTDAEGIYAYLWQDCRTLEPCAVNDAIDNPSWLLRHPRLNVIYAVNEVRDMNGGGSVSAFACDATGGLSLLNRKPSMGADPCHLAIDPAGTSLFVSNYGGGNFAAFPLADDGSLRDFASLVQHGGKGVDPMRQKGPHVHSIVLDAGGMNAYVSDLGLDQVVRYPLRQGSGVVVDKRVTTRLKPGAGPRLFCFDPECRYGYEINELDNTIVSFERSRTGDLVELGTRSSLPDDFVDASYAAHICVTSDNRYLYASNRGHDSIAVFRIEGEGALSLVQHQSTLGKHPRHFALTPDERHLLVANRDSNNVVVMDRDTGTGRLTPTGTVLTVPAPVCVLFCGRQLTADS